MPHPVPITSSSRQNETINAIEKHKTVRGGAKVNDDCNLYDVTSHPQSQLDHRATATASDAAGYEQAANWHNICSIVRQRAKVVGMSQA
jgi:hypothetical protein